MDANFDRKSYANTRHLLAKKRNRAPVLVMLNPSTLLPRQEQHENYTCRVTKKRRCAYDYRVSTGELFSFIALTLKAARGKRDAWLNE